MTYIQDIRQRKRYTTAQVSKVERQSEGGGDRAGAATIVAAAVLLGAMAGCGNSSKTPLSGSASAPASSTNSGVVKRNTPVPTAMSFGFDVTADCLDQFSGSGAQRGLSNGAQTASTPVPKDSGWDTFLSVMVYVFPTKSAAEKFGQAQDPTETIIIGNAVINGSAVTDAYSKQLILGCLNP